jgi:hypothetical protein
LSQHALSVAGADLPIPEATVDDLWVDAGAASAGEGRRWASPSSIP